MGHSFFSDRIPGVSPDQSQALAAELTRGGQLDAAGATVPGVWALDAAAAALPWLAADGLLRDAVVQQLRIAAGDHENMGGCGSAAVI